MSSSSPHPAFETQSAPPAKCSIRECLKSLCRSRHARSPAATSSGALGDSSALPSEPSELEFRASHADGSTPMTTDDDGVEYKEPVVELETPTPQLSTSQSTVDLPSASSSQPFTVNLEGQRPPTLPPSVSVASPSAASLSPSVVASQTTLSRGRVRRRDTEDSESGREDIHQELLSRTPSPTRSPQSIPRLSPGPEMAYSSTQFGQAPIPFRTSFLPTPPNPAPGSSSRPATLPNLSRYTEQTRVMPTDLPTYQRYRQVRRRTAATNSSHGSAPASPNDDVLPTSHRRARTRQHTAGLRRDRERSLSRERRAAETLSAASFAPVAPEATPTAVALPVLDAPDPARGPPTPPPMFMVSHGFGQYPSAETGDVTVPPAIPQSVMSVPAPLAHRPSIDAGTTLNSSPVHSPVQAEETHTPVTPAAGTGSAATSPALPRSSHTNAATTMVNHHQTPPTTIPSGPPPIQAFPPRRRPALSDWESPMYVYPEMHPAAATSHIAFDPAYESRRMMLNQFASYHDQQALARLAHHTHLPPAQATQAMPTRSESLYSRLARLDSLRTDNPVYRGEIPRPFLPVSESTGPGPSRRGTHQTGRTASPAPYDALNPGLPPIPPYVHDSTYRSTPSPWSQSSALGSRWRSMGALSAVAGDLSRPPPRHGGGHDGSLAWFSNSFPFDDLPLPPPSGTQPEAEPAVVEQGVPNETEMPYDDPSMGGAWDLLPHFPIDTLDSGFHDPMQPTALNHFHPFARAREAESRPASTRAQSASGMGQPQIHPPLSFEQLGTHDTAADIPEGEVSAGGGEHPLPPHMFPIPDPIEPPPPLVHSWAPDVAPGAAALIMASGAGAQDVDEFLHSQATWRHHTGPGQYYHHARMGRDVPLHSQIPTIAPRVLSPVFLRHYRIDKNWPIEKQKHLVKVVVRLLNGFTPVHKKLEAQSVLKYVSWDEVDATCAARGMRKETVCAVCYEDVSAVSQT